MSGSQRSGHGGGGLALLFVRQVHPLTRGGIIVSGPMRIEAASLPSSRHGVPRLNRPPADDGRLVEAVLPIHRLGGVAHGLMSRDGMQLSIAAWDSERERRFKVASGSARTER